MGRRNAVQIEDDFSKIRIAAKKASSFKEITQITGLSYSMIRTTLYSKSSYTKIKAQLNINRHLTVQPKAYIIDASIVGSYPFIHVMNKILSSNSKIILTNITFLALKKMARFHDLYGNDSKFILDTFDAYPELFDYVVLDNITNTMDAILDYCHSIKKDIVLLTSSNALLSRAMNDGIVVQYLRQRRYDDKNRIRTLYCAELVDERLQITDFITDTYLVRVYSNDVEYNSGSKTLNTGDLVYVATKKDSYVFFGVFQIISISKENNCKVLYSKKIYTVEEENSLKPSHKDFLKEFFMRFDC